MTQKISKTPSRITHMVSCLSTQKFSFRYLLATAVAFSTLGCGNDKLSEPLLSDSQFQGIKQIDGASADKSEDAFALAKFTLVTTQKTAFKKSTASSGSLPSSSKCTIKKGAYLTLRSEPYRQQGHWKVSIAGNPRGCNFSVGYVFAGHAYIPELGSGNYRLPIQNSFVTSEWCRCRNIGTSPHIGLDLAKYGSMASVALSKGKVSGVYFNGVCGWEVEFRDAGGALWLYRHLNKPNVWGGQSLNAGQQIGYHGAYPQAGCGSGPHLHLERLSSGSFGDSAQGRTCAFGYRSCNYDPGKPFFRMASNPGLQSVDLPILVNKEVAEPESVDAKEKSESACHPLQPAPVKTALVFNDEFLQINSGASSLIQARTILKNQAMVQRSTSDHATPNMAKPISWEVSLSELGKANTENSCGNEGSGKCIEKYEFFVEAKDGSVYRVASSQMVRNSKIQMSEKSNYCVNFKTSGRFGVKASLSDGTHLSHIGIVDRL